MKELKVIEDGILFTFVEDIAGGTFDNKTNWGFTVKQKLEDVKKPRWAKALTIGPKVRDVKEGQYILIENLQWTTALTYNDSRFWKTNESRVMAVSDECPTGIV